MKITPALALPAAIICAFAFASHALAQDSASEPRKPTEKTAFSVNVSGSFSFPRELFASNYYPSSGLGAGMALSIPGDETTGVHTTGVTHLDFSRDMVDFEESTAKRYNLHDNTTASITSLHIGGASAVPVIVSRSYSVSIFSGVAAGGSRFSIDEMAYDSLGRSTLTELIHENNKTNLSTYRQFGMEVFSLHRVSMQYSYNFVEIDRVWKVFHSLVSSTINEIIIDGVPRFVRSTLPEDEKNTRAVHLATFVYKLGTSILWDYYTYEKGNWPYKDEPSMRYHRQTLGLNYYF